MTARYVAVAAALASVACWSASERPQAAEAPADTAYLIAAFRTEAQARLDHLGMRLARLQVAADPRGDWTPALEAIEDRHDELARRIRDFEPAASELPREAGELEAALDTLRWDLDRLAVRVADRPAGDPR